MGVKKRFTLLFDMPEDAFGDEARVTIVGRSQMTLEGSQRLVVCQPEQIVFSTVSGKICVRGEELYLSSTQPGETIVCGKIDQIEYLR